MEPAHRRYYAEMVGDWRGGLHITTAGLTGPWHERLGFWALAVWCARVGPLTVETSVRLTPDSALHTTRIAAGALTCWRSEERFWWLADGASLRITGVRRLGPLRRPLPDASGAVDGDAAGARYRFPWWSDPFEQQVRVLTPGVLAITQRGAGWAATGEIRRIA